MINYSVKRGKYIARTYAGSNTGYIIYEVKINKGSVIFQGKCTHINPNETVEVDCSDWIENWLIQQDMLGYSPTYCEVEVNFKFYRADGSYVLNDLQHINWTPDDLKMSNVNQLGTICAGFDGVPTSILPTSNYPILVAIYPLYFLRLKYKIGNKWYYDENAMFDVNGKKNTTNIYPEPGVSKYTYTSLMKSTAAYSMVYNSLIVHFDPTALESGTGTISTFTDGPRILFHDGNKINQIKCSAFYNDYSEMYGVSPLDYFEYDNYSDAMAAWRYNKIIRTHYLNIINQNYIHGPQQYITDMQGESYTLPVDADHSTTRTMTNIQLELKGYGYKIMFMYNNSDGLIPPVEAFQFAVYTEEYVSCVAPTGDCPTSYLLLVNSGFVNSTNTTGESTVVMSEETLPSPIQFTDPPMDVMVPLMIKNGKLVGKTTNNLEKTTYVDRYNDTHNSILENKYEIECYIDPEWLSVTSGNDLTYEKVILALQNAKETHMISTAPISGMYWDSENNGPIEMEGRVKDIEKIDTYSSYNINHKIPTYKITFEVYN